MKAPRTLRLKGTVAEVTAELRRRASQADTACLLSLASLLLVSACAAEPTTPPPAPKPAHTYHERQSHLRWQDAEE